MTKIAVTLFGIAVSIGLLYFILADISWPDLKVAIASFNLIYALPLLMIYITSYISRAYRWKLLLGGTNQESIEKLTNALLVGALATTVLPLRAGEFIRPWVISRRGLIKFPLLLSSVIVERVFDVLGMLFFLLISLSSLKDSPLWITVSIKGLLLISGLIVFGMVLCVFYSTKLRTYAVHIIGGIFGTGIRSRKLIRFVYELITGFRNIRSVGQLVLIILTSLLVWFQYSLTFYIILLGFNVRADLEVANLLNSLIALAVALPSAPGFIGTFQFGCVSALAAFPEYTKEFAVGFSLVAHLLHVTFILSSGYWALVREKLSFGAMLRSAKK